MTPVTVLTIAGSDSGGGAGIQADLKTFAAFGTYGTSVVTALTAQNTVGVDDVHVPPAEFVDAQITSVLTDFTVAAAKTGMLATTDIVLAVARRAAGGELPNLVVDPVMVATSGDALLEPAAVTAYLERLIPATLVLTPNMREAALLTGRPLIDIDDRVEAARWLHARGARYVVVKGGDAADADAVDVVFDGRTVRLLSAPRIATGNTHGTGCTFSAAIAALLAQGFDVADAIERAKAYVTDALRSAAHWKLGHGHGPLDHFFNYPKDVHD